MEINTEGSLKLEVKGAVHSYTVYIPLGSPIKEVIQTFALLTSHFIQKLENEKKEDEEEISKGEKEE